MRRRCEAIRWALGIASSLACLVSASPGLAADEFCERLTSFEQMPLTQLPGGDLQRRWIDFRWEEQKRLPENEISLGYNLRCEGSDETSKVLCRYFLTHTSIERAASLPLSILHCHGFVFGQGVSRERWIEDLTWTAANGGVEQLQIDQFQRRGHQPSMRLTIMPYPESPQAKKPEPFFKALSAKLDPSNKDRD